MTDEKAAPRLAIEKTSLDGKPALRLVVFNAIPELCELLDELGVLPEPGNPDRRSIVRATPKELNAACGPLQYLFGENLEWLGRPINEVLVKIGYRNPPKRKCPLCGEEFTHQEILEHVTNVHGLPSGGSSPASPPKDAGN